MLKRFSVDLGYNPVDMVVRCALTGKMLNDIESVPKNVADYNKIAVVCNYLLKGSNETVARIVGLEEMKKIPSYVCRPIANYLAVAFTPSNPVLHVKNGQLQSYAYMDDFASQFYSGPRLAFEDPEEDKRT